MPTLDVSAERLARDHSSWRRGEDFRSSESQVLDFNKLVSWCSSLRKVPPGGELDLEIRKVVYAQVFELHGQEGDRNLDRSWYGSLDLFGASPSTDLESRTNPELHAHLTKSNPFPPVVFGFKGTLHLTIPPVQPADDPLEITIYNTSIAGHWAELRGGGLDPIVWAAGVNTQVLKRTVDDLNGTFEGSIENVSASPPKHDTSLKLILSPTYRYEGPGSLGPGQ